MNEVLEVRPDITVSADCRNADGAPFLAWLSRRPRFSGKVIVEWYTYFHEDGFKFVKDVEQQNPASSWRRIPQMPVLFPDQLWPLAERLLGIAPSLSYTMLKAGGQAFIDSVLSQRMRVESIGFIFSGAGKYIDRNTGTVTLPSGLILTDAKLALFFLTDRVLMDLAISLKQQRPAIIIAGINRSYDWAIVDNELDRYIGRFTLDGTSVPWPSDATRIVREMLATPGAVPLDILNWVTADRPREVISALVHREMGLFYTGSHIDQKFDVKRTSRGGSASTPGTSFGYHFDLPTN